MYTNKPAYIKVNGTAGFTLIEMMIVVAVFSILVWATYRTMNSAATVEQQQQRQSHMQDEARNAIEAIVRDLEESSLSYVDTTMRWRNGGQWEAYNKFHGWFYRQFSGGVLYPGLVQCPEPQCSWSFDATSGDYRVKNSIFTTNYNHHDSDDHFKNIYFPSYGTGKGFANSGRIHNRYFDDDEHSYSGSAPGSYTSAQCLYDGSLLSPVVQLDALQFPVARNVKDEYVTGEGNTQKPDWQGWLVFAPFYNGDTRELALRRYAVFVSDLFQTFPWDNNKPNPLYDPDEMWNQRTMNAALVAVADSFPVSSNYITGLANVNWVETDPNNDGPPPDWPSTGKPTLHNLFDFDGDSLIENDIDADGDGTITTGAGPTADSEASIEQFRLIPSESMVNSGRFDDWSGGRNGIKGIVYHKYEGPTSSDLRGSYDMMEIFYFIDLETGWTRFFYECRWSGNQYYINASYVRASFSDLTAPVSNPPSYDSAYSESRFFVPYEQVGKGIVGLDFSTPDTFPDTFDGGLEDASNSARLAIMVDRRIHDRGKYKYPELKFKTRVAPNQTD